MTPVPLGILLPTFALVLLIFVIWIVMMAGRGRHMRTTPPRAEDFANNESAGRYFAPVEMPSNNFRNLFEMPVVYFALVPLLILADAANIIQVTFAWAFVFLRIGHSFVHVGPNKVPVRATLYILSTAVLMVMWFGFAWDVCTDATPYADAPNSIEAL